MPSGALTSRSILACQPSNVAHVSDAGVLAQDRLEQHQHPFVDRIDEDDELTLRPFEDGFPHPCRRAFLLALVHDRTERRVDVVLAAPLAGEPVKTVWQRIRAGIKER